MNETFKKLLLVLVTLLLGVVSGGPRAQVPTGATGYDFTATFSDDGFDLYLSGTVWTNSSGTVNYYTNLKAGTTSSTAISVTWDGLNSYPVPGTANGGMINGLNNYGFEFTYKTGYGNYDAYISSVFDGSYSYTPEYGLRQGYGNAATLADTATAAAPEIDGSLAPKVGFLLSCLFLIFGRKKENADAILAV